MSHATSVVPGPVILDWRHAAIGPLAPCVCCGKPALCRSPVRDVPCHKHCAETWITGHASRSAPTADPPASTALRSRPATASPKPR